MPVKIKHKQLKKLQWVDYDNYFHNYMNNSLYETLAIKDLYELYNRISGTELWQATLEKEAANHALKKNPAIFRIEYSDKNTPKREKITKPAVEFKPITILTMSDTAIINAERANQLRDSGLLSGNFFPNTEPDTPQIAPQTTKAHIGTSLFKRVCRKLLSIHKNKIFIWIVSNIWLFILYVLVGLTVAYFVFLFKWNK